MSVRVALFGTKFMGKAHSQAYRNVNMYFGDAPEIEMAVLVGRNPDETEQSRKTYGWQEASTDWKAVMRRDDIDVVDIATPGHMHVEMALEAAKNGKHIICEKPLANTLPEAERMLEAVNAALAADGKLLSEEERTAMTAELEQLRNLIAGSNHRAIKAAIERLNHSTESFAARRMDRSVRQALAGKNIANV